MKVARIPHPKRKRLNVITGKIQLDYCSFCDCDSCRTYTRELHSYKKRTLLKFMKEDQKMQKLYKDQLMKMVRDSDHFDETDDKMLMNYLHESSEEPTVRDPTPLSDELNQTESFPVTQA